MPEEERFDIVTICPSFVFGKTLLPGGFAIAHIIQSYFDGSLSELDLEPINIVDMHDVSRMHVDAIIRPEIKNERFIASTEKLYPKEIADILSAEFEPKGFKVTTKEKEGARIR